jgi:hypothetical protein
MKQARYRSGPECLTGKAGLRVDRASLLCHRLSATKDGVSLLSARILCKCKKMAQILSSGRRSFRAVGESCVTNLIPDQYNHRLLNRSVDNNHCEASPTFERRDKQPNVTNCRNRQGADLPSVGNWWLIQGWWKACRIVGVTNSLSLDRLWRK